ncbi:LRR domain containing protein [Parasponia andersonii]|uniref:LRR domain containing protein n=1 Tax=Parasponia andersonii TaxID=3476 RepID=A0A2P5A6S9_PARAD|nr:LRR domain containing protein [Parasponia andersonii]
MLDTLDLSRNNPEGAFPASILKLKSLTSLYLSHNKFSGTIEVESIIQEIALHVLELSYNSWGILQLFDLARNNFSGKLPGEFFTKWRAMMTEDDAQVLGFATPLSFYNYFLPPMVQSNSDIEYNDDAMKVTPKGLERGLSKIQTIFTNIDLSCNNFHEAIPEEVGLLKALHVLNLSNNPFTREIPSSIGNLQ